MREISTYSNDLSGVVWLTDYGHLEDNILRSTGFVLAVIRELV